MQEALVKARDQILLNPDDLPGSWYNVLADLPGEFPKPKDPDEVHPGSNFYRRFS